MATRLTQAERRAQTRRALLDSARRAFGERGFAGASLDEIAEAAGLTRGALYYHFPDGKEGLFLALLEERLRDRATAIRATFAAAAPEVDIAGLAREAADDAQAALVANREWQLLIFEFALHAARHPAFARRYRKIAKEIRRAIEDVISERAQALGLTPPIPAGELARAVNALGVGLALDTLVEPKAVRQGLFGDVLSLLASGLLALDQAAPGPSDPKTRHTPRRTRG